MVAVLADLVRVNSATVGAGTLTLGLAVSGFLTFAQGGITSGQTVTYAIQDPGNAFPPTAMEIGRGVYTASGPTLTRGPLWSSNSNAAINCSGNQHVFITAAAEDFPRWGTATLNFGAWPGSFEASVAIALPWMQAGSIVTASVMPAATADHTVDEHVIDGPVVVAGNVAAGAGFTIYGVAPKSGLLFGAYSVAWEAVY